MRFRRIEIPAFGNFTNFLAEFPRGETDFHLVYGPNEAGKSTLLRAIRGLLFGIPQQNPDNFRHDYHQFRLIGELEDAKGGVRTFERRKGRTNTLLDTAGAPIPEDELRVLLGGVDQAYFDSLFGLGAAELRRGADELLRGEGRLGEALFSASLGGTPVDQVIRSLEAEAGAIFSGRSIRKIREMVRTYSGHQTEKAAHLIMPDTWESIERDLAEQNKTLQRLVGERNSVLERREWLSSCRVAVSSVGQLDERLLHIDELKDLPDLSRSFVDEIREARSAAGTAAQEVERIEGDLERLQGKMDASLLRPEILAESGRIDRLHTDLGTYRENLRGLATKRGEADAKRRAVETGCRNLGIPESIDQLEPLRLTLPQLAEAEELARQMEKAERTRDEADQRFRSLEDDLAALRAKPSRGDAALLAALTQAIHVAAAVESIAETLDRREAAGKELEGSLQRLHRDLAGAPADLRATSELPVPTQSRIDSFREKIEENERQLRTLDTEIHQTAESIRTIEAGLERSARLSDVPSLDDLTSSREHRDRGWSLVLRAWKGGVGEETFVEDRPLEEAYPEAVASADRIADRLRLEAEAVAQREEQRSKLELAVAKMTELEAQRARARETATDLAGQWSAAWKSCRVSPLSPREMIAWREDWQRFVQEWDKASSERRQIERDRTRVDAVSVELARVLGTTPTVFAKDLAEARERRNQLDAARDEDSRRDARIEDLEGEREQLLAARPAREASFASAQERWDALCRALSLSPTARPAPAIEALRSRRELFRDFDEWRALLVEVDRLQESVARFEREVRNLADRLKIVGETPDLLEAALWLALGKAKTAQTEHESLLKQSADLKNQLSEVRRGAQRERERFDTLFAQTGLTEEGELESLLSRLEDRQAHRDKVSELRDRLHDCAQGMPLDDFIRGVRAEDGAKLSAEISDLEEQEKTLSQQIEAARSARQDLETRRGALEGAQDQAARHEQDAEFALSSMAAAAERFVRLRVAIALLESQIDTFRRQNQGPMMEKASEWFAQITGASFRGIATSYGKGDTPVIVGLRSGDDHPQEVPVSGMSEGSRDQLHLALRFAGLERHLEEGHVPMPLILDDLLVNFDDGRAAHALKALARLGPNSQVLLFTHHAHLVELAQSTLGPEGFHLVKIA